MKKWPQCSSERINACQNGKQVDQRMLMKTTGLLWGPPLQFHLTAWVPNIQGNKNTGLWCAGRMTTVQLSPQSCEGAHVTWGTSLLFVPRYWSSVEIKRLREALIRGRAVSQVSYEPGPPTSLLFVCTVSPDPLGNCITNFKKGPWGFGRRL